MFNFQGAKTHMYHIKTHEKSNTDPHPFNLGKFFGVSGVHNLQGGWGLPSWSERKLKKRNSQSPALVMHHIEDPTKKNLDHTHKCFKKNPSHENPFRMILTTDLF